MKKLSKIAWLALMIPAMVACGGGTSSAAKTSSAATSSAAPASSVAPASSAAPASSVAPASSQAPASSEAPADTSVEPGGPTEYVFEAEYSPDIEDLAGNGYSGEARGTNMILQDRKGELEASNGYYLSFLYKPMVKVTYTFNSDRAVSDAKFVWRITAEYYDMTISPNNYEVAINGSSIDYTEISFTIPENKNVAGPFSDYTLTETCEIQEGENVVSFLTANMDLNKGTMIAMAPEIDCFKITTDAVLTWDPCTDNI